MLATGLSLAARTALAWWPSGALYAADFVNDRYMRTGNASSAAEAFGFTRPSSKWAQRSDGSWVEFGHHTPARTDLGLSLEPASTNLVPNPGLFGAAVGVIGKDGSLPAGWFASGALTTEVLALTTLAGLPALRLRFYGTPSANFFELNMIPAGTAIQASAAYSASIFSQVHFGSGHAVEVRQGTAADTFVVANPLHPVPSISLTRSQIVFTSNAAAASLRLRLNYSLTAGQAVEAEVTLACPQVEARNSVTSPLLQARSADALVLALPPGGYDGKATWRNFSDTQFSGEEEHYTFNPAAPRDYLTSVAAERRNAGQSSPQI